MSYEPREGVDYIINYYAVLQVEPTAEPAEIKSAIQARQKEYHPDRVDGTAPEFVRRSQQMGKLVNVASGILLDTEKRGEFDRILHEWGDRPVSKDGTPIITRETMIREAVAGKSPAEIEDDFADFRRRVEAQTGHNQDQLDVLRLMSQIPGLAPDMQQQLRQGLDHALLTQDRVLGIEEAQRGELVGYAVNERYETEIGYADKVVVELEAAEAALAQEYAFRALGGVGTRLALLGSDAPASEAISQDADIVPTTGALPPYFEDQAKKISDLARQREELLVERLANFQPTYFIPEVQTEGKSNFAINITLNSETGKTAWLCFAFNAANVHVNAIDTPQDISPLLEAGDYEGAYAAGYNVLAYTVLEQIEFNTLLREAVDKHIAKFFPDLMAE